MLGRVALALLTHQAVVQVKMEMDRHTKYVAAQKVARRLSKPLLVVGGPWGVNSIRQVFRLKAHGCGDMCLDIDPNACEGCPYTYGDIRNLPFADREFGAVFCSHVLEHMPTPEDCTQAWGELNRVADHVFICLPGKDCVAAWLAPGHHLWVEQVSGDLLKVEDRHSPQVLYAYGRPAAASSRAPSGRFDLQRLISVTDTT